MDKMLENPVAPGKRRDPRKLWTIGIFVVVLGVTGYWWRDSNSAVPNEDVFNPIYWYRRAKGEDLYDASTLRLFHGNHLRKEIALTIDDGPHTPTGDQLLDILKMEDVKATFFVVGAKLKQRPDLIRRMVAEGHEVANHTQDHLRLPSLNARQVEDELNNCDINFYRVTKQHFNLMRPPGVQYNDKVLAITKKMNYQVITWTCAAKDFDDVSPDYIVNRILSRVENGSIILLHDDRPSTVTALPRIIAALKKDGYTFVTITEMLAHLPNPVILTKNVANSKSQLY